jgi:hypothetical protein
MLAGTIAASPAPVGAAAAAGAWVHQLGSGSSDYGYSVAVDPAGNTYVAGATNGRLPGAHESNAGGFDVFVAKFSKAGSRLWVHLLGTPSGDYAYGIAADATGNAYITGTTNGRLGRAPEGNAGDEDAFVAKYTPSGSRAWIHLLGSKASEDAFGIALDRSGNPYVVGATQGSLPGAPEKPAGRFDVFVAKFTKTGSRAWVHRLGTTRSDFGRAVAVDRSGNAYVTGYTEARLPGAPGNSAGRLDVFVAKYSSAGARAWVRQLGSKGTDIGYGVGVDRDGSAYVSGVTDGRLAGSTEANAGTDDAFVAKYSKSGARVWVHQLGTSGSDIAYAVAVDAAGNAYLAGSTARRLPLSSEPNAGGFDVFVARYTKGGARVSVHQLGDVSQDDGFGIAVDGGGNTLVTGITRRLPSAPETNQGGFDAFVARDL